MIPTRGPGKPHTVCKETLKDTVLSHKGEILLENAKIASATANVWIKLSIKLGIKPTTIHSYVVNDRFDLRKILLRGKLEDSLENSQINTTVFSDDTTSTAADTSVDCLDNFTFAIPKTEFKDLITEVVHRSTTKKGKKIKRIRTVLRPKIWAEKFSAHLWNSLHLKHGFHFANHHLTRSATSGYIKGSCKCGAEIRCRIDNDSDDLNTKFECRIIKTGEGKDCGKRQLRGVKRQKIAAELCHKSVDVFRAEQRRALQRHGDPDPPLLYTDSVLRTAKHQYIESQYLHKNPIDALKLMKRTAFGKNIIQSIGNDPFFIHIFSNHQIRLWNQYSEEVPLIIDSTSGIATKILHTPVEKSHTLFLHLAVINCELGQFSVSEAITERQDSVTIEYWLKRIIQSAANYPKQVICDSSRALLTACISAFTNFLTIEEYCDAFKTDPLSMHNKTLISIDVAHYIKLWANFLKTKNRRIKVFYLASIGQLILSRSEEDAKDLIIMLLTVAMSETDGKLIKGNRVTLCEKHKNHLRDIITGQLPEYERLCNEVETEEKSGESGGNEDSDDTENNAIEDGRTRIEKAKIENSKTGKNSRKQSMHSNAWEKWALEIELEVKRKIKNEIGDRDNAHFDPRIAERLMKEIRHLPMWSNLYNTKFNVENIRPSSSASVECEIKKIKHNVLGKKGKYSRVDATVEKIIKYYDGKLRILSANDDFENEVTQYETEGSNVLEEIDEPGVLEIKTENNSDLTTPTMEFEKSDNINGEEPSLHNEESPSHDRQSAANNNDSHLSKEGDVILVSQFGTPMRDPGIHDFTYEEESAAIDQKSPLKDLTNNVRELCVACLRGDQPEGAHSCRVCKKKVHALPGYSMEAEEEEGYGQRRLCMNCYSSKDLNYKMALTEIENHKGLALKDLRNDNQNVRRRNRYLGQSKEKISDMLLYESNNKENLPILKNGNAMKMNFVTINGAKYSFHHTCALDSFYQIILAATIDYAHFQDYVQTTAENNPLFEIVSDTLKKRITANTYRLRGTLLLNFKGTQIHGKTIEIVKCDSAINDLINHILQKQPSIEQKITCTNGCAEIINKEYSAILQINHLKNNKNFFDIIKRNMKRKRRCLNCQAEVGIEITNGKMICIEIYGLIERELHIKLGTIPKKFKDGIDEFRLIGLIDYYGSEVQKENEMGHYTGISFRGTWVQYDDCKLKPKVLKDTYITKPKILCYIKEEN